MSSQWLTAVCGATALSISISAPAHAETGWRLENAGSDLRTRETRSAALKWELGFLALSAIDAAQTIECLNRHACTEVNPLFGKRPSTRTIILTKLGGGLAHFALFSYINDRDPKLALRAAQVSFALQGTVVLLNARVTF
jgi:hypothetical protein